MRLLFLGKYFILQGLQSIKTAASLPFLLVTTKQKVRFFLTTDASQKTRKMSHAESYYCVWILVIYVANAKMTWNSGDIWNSKSLKWCNFWTRNSAYVNINFKAPQKRQVFGYKLV